MVAKKKAAKKRGKGKKKRVVSVYYVRNRIEWLQRQMMKGNNARMER